jgi:hypothetical protein
VPGTPFDDCVDVDRVDAFRFAGARFFAGARLLGERFVVAISPYLSFRSLPDVRPTQMALRASNYTVQTV